MVMLGLLLPEAAHRTAMLMFIEHGNVANWQNAKYTDNQPQFPDSTYLGFHLAPKGNT